MSNVEQQGFKPNNGSDPAQPVMGVLDINGDTRGQLFHGLTKREHFAAMAMQGICATYQPDLMGADGSDARICAKYAIEHADALLAALEAK